MADREKLLRMTRFLYSKGVTFKPENEGLTPEQLVDKMMAKAEARERAKAGENLQCGDMQKTE